MLDSAEFSLYKETLFDPEEDMLTVIQTNSSMKTKNIVNIAQSILKTRRHEKSKVNNCYLEVTSNSSSSGEVSRAQTSFSCSYNEMMSS